MPRWLLDRVRAIVWLLVPLGAYLMVTVVLPLANGAAGRADFVQHTLRVSVACIAAFAIATLISITYAALRLGWRHAGSRRGHRLGTRAIHRRLNSGASS